MADYLLNRPSGIYFRYVIPRRFRSVVSLKEIRYPLHTRFQAVAKRRSRIVAAQLELYLSKGARDGVTVTNQQIRQIIQSAIQEAREVTFEGHINRLKPLTPNERHNEIDQAEYFLGDLREALGLSDYRVLKMDRDVGNLLREQGIELDPSSTEFKQACRDLIGGHIAVLEEYIELLNGGDPSERNKAQNTAMGQGEGQSTKISAAPNTSPSSLAAQAYFEEFAQDKRTRSGVSEHTINEYATAIADLAFILGDTPANEVKSKEVAFVTDTLLKLPRSRNVGATFRGKSLNQILAMDVPEDKRLTPSTVKQCWIIINGGLPVTGLLL